MPRISPERREARRAEIVAAARRCFSRDGFHQTSMPDIAAEAGIATGATYRYFSSKEEIILEIAGDAFRLIFDPIDHLVDGPQAPTTADLIAASVDPVREDVTLDKAGRPVPVDELLRCAVQAWAELLRHEPLRRRATEGFEHVRRRIAEALRHGQAAGTVPADLDPDRGARVVMALLHGFVLQRTAFGLEDPTTFAEDVRALLTSTGPPTPS